MPRFLLQARHQMRPLLHADDHGLLYSTVSCMCVTLFTISLVYFVRPRKEETRVQSPKKKKGKERNAHSFYYRFTRSLQCTLSAEGRSNREKERKTRSRRASVVHAVRVYLCLVPTQNNDL